MAWTYDSAGGTKVVTGQAGKAELKFGTGSAIVAWLQDWSLNTTFKNIDVTPIGYQGSWKVPAGKETSGSAKMNFRTDSEAQAKILNLFGDITTTESATPTTQEADSDVAILAKLYVNGTDYFEVSITIESANLAMSAGNAMTFDINFSVKGEITFNRTVA